jgi:two-component system, OmpR family, alkaline phosphatase synthesis response regulator PhoP
MSKRILLVEDDRSIAKLLLHNLSFEGFTVEWSERGEDAIQVARAFKPDLVLLDVMLPQGFDGLQLCRALSQGTERVPVIVVSARGEKDDRILGLTLGADDYVTKPFALDELLARINAVLRRSTPRLRQVSFGDVIIDFVGLRAWRGKEELVMTDREFDILRYLAERAGAIVSRDELLRAIWGYADTPLTRTVDNFVFRLRHKLEADPKHPRYIRTVYGDGYRLTIDP